MTTHLTTPDEYWFATGGVLADETDDWVTWIVCNGDGRTVAETEFKEIADHLVSLHNRTVAIKRGNQ
jgi:hypothetical protein